MIRLEHVINTADSQQGAQFRTQGWKVGLGAQVVASKVKKMFAVCALQLTEDLLACKQIIVQVVVDIIVHRI